MYGVQSHLNHAHTSLSYEHKFLNTLLVPISNPLSSFLPNNCRQHLLINCELPCLSVSSNTAKQSSSYTPTSLEQPLYITTCSLITARTPNPSTTSQTVVHTVCLIEQHIIYLLLGIFAYCALKIFHYDAFNIASNNSLSLQDRPSRTLPGVMLKHHQFVIEHAKQHNNIKNNKKIYSLKFLFFLI